jgi:CubicO group peptidase (beta-lactamase class C family)
MGRPYAVGHRIEGGKPVQVRIANDAALWPAGYAWSNAAEMTRLLSALVNGGRVYSKTSIPVAAIGAVTTPRVPMPNVFVGGQYGHGMMIARDREVLMYEHGGTMPGFSSILRIAPGRRLGIAVLTNVENAPLRRLAQNVMAKVLGLPAATPPVRDERAVTAEEMKPFIGMFRNHGTAEIAVADTGVTLSLDGGPAMAVTRIGDDRFLARPKPDVAGPEFVLKPATSGTPAYLHFALWAYAKDK